MKFLLKLSILTAWACYVALLFLALMLTSDDARPEEPVISERVAVTKGHVTAAKPKKPKPIPQPVGC